MRSKHTRLMKNPNKTELKTAEKPAAKSAVAPKQTQVSALLPEDVYRKVKAAADEDDRTIANQIRVILKAWAEKAIAS